MGVMVELERGTRVAVEVEEQGGHLANEPYTHMRTGAAQLRFWQLTRVLGQGNVVRVNWSARDQELQEALRGALKGWSGSSAEQAGRDEGRGVGRKAGRGRAGRRRRPSGRVGAGQGAQQRGGQSREPRSARNGVEAAALKSTGSAS